LRRLPKKLPKKSKKLPKKHSLWKKIKVKTFNVIIERDTEGFYVATVPELKGCHTQAKSLGDVLLERIKEAIELCVEVEDVPITTEFVGLQRIAMTR